VVSCEECSEFGCYERLMWLCCRCLRWVVWLLLSIDFIDLCIVDLLNV